MFKVGDIVQLKSGGPQMTITRLYNNKCYCQWFEKENVKSHAFPRVALKSFDLTTTVEDDVQ